MRRFARWLSNVAGAVRAFNESFRPRWRRHPSNLIEGVFAPRNIRTEYMRISVVGLAVGLLGLVLAGDGLIRSFGTLHDQQGHFAGAFILWLASLFLCLTLDVGILMDLAVTTNGVLSRVRTDVKADWREACCCCCTSEHYEHAVSRPMHRWPRSIRP